MCETWHAGIDAETITVHMTSQYHHKTKQKLDKMHSVCNRPVIITHQTNDGRQTDDRHNIVP